MKPSLATQVRSLGLPDRLVRAVEEVQQLLRVGAGVLPGDKAGQWITRGDLIQWGFATEPGGGMPLVPAGPPDTPGGGAEAPDYTPPPTPENVQAIGGYTSIFVVWDAVRDRRIGYFEVWRASVDDIGQAVKIGQTTSFQYIDEVQNSARYYYWVRSVNAWDDAIVSPFNAVAGTMGETAPNASYVLELLTGQITQSQLHTDLGSRIDMIGPLESDVTGLQTNVDNLLGTVGDLQAVVSDLSGTPAYDNGATYPATAIVAYNGGLYRAIQATTGNLPTDTNYWEKIGDYASLGEAVAAHTLSISDHESRIGIVEGDLTSEITDRQTLATQLRGGYSGTDAEQLSQGLIWSERQLRSSAIQSEAQARDALATQLRGAYAGGDIDQVTTGLIASEKAARSNADGSLASDISTLRTDAQTWDGQTLTSAQSWVQSNYTTTAGVNSALAAQESDLRAEWQQNDGTTLASAQSYVQGYAYSKSAADQVAAQAASQVGARLDSGGDVYQSIVQAQTTANARATTFMQGTAPTAKATGDLWMNTAAGNKVLRWSGSAWVAADDARIGTTASQVTTLQSVTIPAITGNVTGLQDDIGILQGDVADHGGRIVSVEQSASTSAGLISGLQGQYTVKIDNDGYVSGYGLASTFINDAPYSTFEIRADSFAIASPSGLGIGPEMPFVVQTTPTTIDGITFQPGVYMTQAVIKKAIVENFVAGLAVIDDASIKNVRAGKILADKLGVGQYIESQGYIAGSTGWRINANGTAEFQTAIVRGTVYASAGAIAGVQIFGSYLQSSNYVAGANGFRVRTDGSAEFNNILARGDIEASSVKANTAVYGGSYGPSYSWPVSGGGFHLSASGLLLGNANGGQRGYFQVTSDGRVFAPGFSLSDGNVSISGNATVRGDVQATSLNASAANIVDTLHVRGSAITAPSAAKLVAGLNGWGAYIYLENLVRDRPVLIWGACGGTSEGFNDRSLGAYYHNGSSYILIDSIPRERTPPTTGDDVNTNGYLHSAVIFTVFWPPSDGTWLLRVNSGSTVLTSNTVTFISAIQGKR